MAADEFALKVLKKSVAQLCSTIGFTHVQTSTLEVLTEITKRFMLETGRHAHRYSELSGRTQPILEDFALAFEDMGVSVASLEEYVQNIQPIPPVHQVPQFPIPTQMQLNFMKPGSREVLTRPVHIQEYLPPMNPSLEEEQQQESLDVDMNLSIDAPSTSPSRVNQLKRPGEAPDVSASKRLRMYGEEEQRVREITSVMMTTSGFISEAREGKLPEARLPMPFFDEEEEVVDVKPKKALPLRKWLEGKKSEPVDTKKVKQEPSPEPLPPVAPPKKVKESKHPKPEPVKAQPVEEPGYTVKPLPQPPVKPPKPAEPEKPQSKLKIFEKWLKRKEDKKPETIDVETVKESPRVERSPSPPPRAHPPSPPPRTPSPPPTPGRVEKKKRKRKEKLKVKSAEAVGSGDESMERVESPPPRFDRNFPFVPPMLPSGEIKELPSALKNLPPGLLGIRPGGVPSFPVRPVFPPPLPTPAPKERTPPPASKSPSPVSPGENLMTSPISDTHFSDVQSPTGRESPKKIKKEKKKKDKKLKSKDKEERIKEKEEKVRLKEEKKLKKEEKRALKKMREEKEAEEAEKLERQKEKEKEKEKEKAADDASLPKITFKFGSPPPLAEKSPTPEPPAEKTSSKPPKKEKESKKEKEPPKEIITPKVEEPVVIPPKKKERKKSPSKAIQEEPRKKSPPPAKVPTPQPPTVKPPTPKPPTPKPPTPKPPPPPKAAPTPKVSTPKPAKKIPPPSPAPPPPPETPEPKKKVEKAPKTPKQKEVKKEKVSPKAEKAAKPGRKKQAETPVIQSVGSYFDDAGNKIWICPACGRQDDGTPMIGCDECDDWYHWVCVGIRVAPSESENWYCQRCIEKKKGMIPEKKKGKKKKGD